MADNVTYDLRQQAEAARALIANFNDILGDDEDAKLDAIEGETDLLETVDIALNRILLLESLEEGLKIHANNISDRRSRMKKQAEFLRTAIGVALAQSDITSLELPMATLSRKAVPVSAIITEEADLPSEFLKTEVKVDKSAVLKALKAGDEVPGATLSNGGETIQIRKR